MAAAGQIRLAVVTSDKSGAVPAVLADGVVVRTQIAAIDAELARLPDSGPAQAGAVEISRPQ